MDLYALLGVSRAASAADIERAYRRLARRYHPGINPGDRAAEEMFRRVQDAFEVLGDLDRRRQYDRGAARDGDSAPTDVTVSFEGFDFSSAAEGGREPVSVGAVGRPAGPGGRRFGARQRSDR